MCFKTPEKLISMLKIMFQRDFFSMCFLRRARFQREKLAKQGNCDTAIWSFQLAFLTNTWTKLLTNTCRVEKQSCGTFCSYIKDTRAYKIIQRSLWSPATGSWSILVLLSCFVFPCCSYEKQHYLEMVRNMIGAQFL